MKLTGDWRATLIAFAIVEAIALSAFVAYAMFWK